MAGQNHKDRPEQPPELEPKFHWEISVAAGRAESLRLCVEILAPGCMVPVKARFEISNLKSPETCPNCGADVPARAKSCPECGADEHTGWSEEACASGLDLPDDSFDYDDFVQRELDPGKKPIPRGIHWFWWLVAIAVAAVFAIGALRFLG